MLRSKKGTDRRVRQQTNREKRRHPTTDQSKWSSPYPAKYSPFGPLMHHPRRRHPNLHSLWMWGGPYDQGRNELTPTPTGPPKKCLPPPHGAQLVNNRLPENVKRRELTHKHPATNKRKGRHARQSFDPSSPNAHLQGGGASYSSSSSNLSL